MADMPPWERVTVSVCHITFPEDGHLLLVDGRRIVVPGDHRCVIGPDGSEDSDARARWREMGRLVASGRTARVRIRDGRLVAVGHASALSHPTDIAILSALGLDAEGALEAFRDGVHWVAPDVQLVHQGGWHPDFHITMPSRFTANFEIDGTTSYEGGELLLAEREIPESARVALEGRPLGDLVHIPALAGMDLPILRVEHHPSPFTGKSRLTVTLADEEGWVDFLLP